MPVSDIFLRDHIPKKSQPALSSEKGGGLNKPSFSFVEGQREHGGLKEFISQDFKRPSLINHPPQIITTGIDCPENEIPASSER